MAIHFISQLKALNLFNGLTLKFKLLRPCITQSATPHYREVNNLNDGVVQYLSRYIQQRNPERLKPVFYVDYPVGSTAVMRTV